MYNVVHLELHFFAIERTFLFNILVHHNEIYKYIKGYIYPYSCTFCANVPTSREVILTIVKDANLFSITSTLYMFTINICYTVLQNLIYLFVQHFIQPICIEESI